jgi:hypothetical protein
VTAWPTSSISPSVGVLHRLGDAEMFDLGVGEHLVHLVDRPGRHPGPVETVDPFGAGVLLGDLLDRGIERLAVVRARAAGLVVGVLGQLRPVDRAAEAAEDLVAGRGDVDIAVAGLKHAGRDAGRVVVAGLLRHLVRDGPARALEVEHRDLRRQQRAFDPLALARHLALQQRDQDAHRAENPRRQIGDRDADPHRSLPRQPGDRHEPAHALGDLVEAGPVAIGAALAEARDAGIDQARVDRL